REDAEPQVVRPATAAGSRQGAGLRRKGLPSRGRPGLADEDADRADELGLGAEVAEALVPDAEGEVIGEAADEGRLVLLVDEAPGRLGAADGGLEHCLGAAVEGIGEAI